MQFSFSSFDKDSKSSPLVHKSAYKRYKQLIKLIACYSIFIARQLHRSGGGVVTQIYCNNMQLDNVQHLVLTHQVGLEFQDFQIFLIIIIKPVDMSEKPVTQLLRTFMIIIIQATRSVWVYLSKRRTASNLLLALTKRHHEEEDNMQNIQDDTRRRWYNFITSLVLFFAMSGNLESGYLIVLCWGSFMRNVTKGIVKYLQF